MNTDIGNGKKKRIEYEFCCDGCEFANGNFLECVESNVMFCKRTLKQHDSEVYDKGFKDALTSHGINLYIDRIREMALDEVSEILKAMNEDEPLSKADIDMVVKSIKEKKYARR